MAEDIQYPQFSAEGLPLTYVPDPFKADGAPVSDQWKEPVRVHSTGDVVRSGLQTIDGVALMEGDRVLLKDQVDPAENGIYVASSGTWLRARDCYLWAQFVGAVAAASEGAPGDDVWVCQVGSTGTVDTTPNYWVSVAKSTGTLPAFTPLRAIVSDVAGTPIASPTTAQEIAYVSGVTSSIQEQFAALDNEASSAFAIAVAGTNAAALAQSTANTAISTANSAFSIAVAGTNAAGAAQNTASSALSVANSAFNIAVIGTNVGTAAYNAALSAQSTADSAFSIAVQGTNAAATALSTANAAYTLAEAGTDIGSLAYTVATGLGDKYVRTTRFASIGAGTGGAVTLPANSIVVLDDFGGGVDAVVTTISAGRPTFSHAFTAAGDLVTTSFDAGGNYTLSGAPSAYPVALIYRVRQKLSEFDSTSSDIIGSYDVEGLDSLQGTADQVYVNGSLGPQFGALTLTLPQNIGTSSSVSFANGTFDGNVLVKAVDFNVAASGTVARETGRLWWDDRDKTLRLGMAGTAVTQQVGEEVLIYGLNNTSAIIPNGAVVYAMGGNGTYPTVAPASAAVRSQSRGVVGMATEDILPGVAGYVTTQGLVRGLDTSLYAQGRPLFLSTTAGGLTLVPPAAPYSTVFIGLVVSQNGSEGAIFVSIANTAALGELQDVGLASAVSGQSLQYNGSVWVNAFPAGGAGQTQGVFTYWLNGTYGPEFPGYEQFTTTPASGPEVIESGTVTATGSVLLDQCLSGTFGRTQLDGGEWVYHTYARADKTSCNMQVKTFVLSGTVESPLWTFTTLEVPTLVGPVIEYIFGTTTAVNPSDRLLVRYYAQRTGAGNAVVSLYHGGNTNYTHISTPFPAFHNELAGLQGGDGFTDTYYHLSGSQYAVYDQTVADAATALSVAQSGTGLQTFDITAGTTAVVSNAVYLANASSGSVVALLPAASSSLYFHAYVKKVDATGGYVYVRASGANTVDGTAEKFFNVPYTAMHVVCNGTNWFIL